MLPGCGADRLERAPAQPLARGRLQPVRRDDDVGVDVLRAPGIGAARDLGDRACAHRISSRTSASRPVTAAAAAIAGRQQVRARARPLPADEIAVAGRGAALARRHLVGVHRQAHRAAGLAPFEAGLDEDAVEPLGLGLALDQPRAGHDQRADAVRDVAAVRHRGGGAQILDPAVGAAADEDILDARRPASRVPGVRPM